MWRNVEKKDLAMVLSQDEIDKLENLSTNYDDIFESSAVLVSNMIRGALSAKGFSLSTLENSIPESYMLIALILIRSFMWSRFPHSNIIAIDEIRLKESEWAKEVLKELPYNPDKIDSEHNPDNPDNPDYVITDNQGTIKVPYLRFPQYPYGDDFNSLINKKNLY